MTTYDRSLENDINLTDGILKGLSIVVENNILIIDNVLMGVSVTVEDDILLANGNLPILIYHWERPDWDGVVLGDVIGRNITVNPGASNNVLLNYTLGPTSYTIVADNDIALHQAGWHSVRWKDANNDIIFDNEVIAGKTINRSVEHEIIFHQKCGNAKDESISSDVAFDAECGTGELSVHDVTFAASASATCGKPSSNNISFSDEAIGNCFKAISVSNDVTFDAWNIGM